FEPLAGPFQDKFCDIPELPSLTDSKFFQLSSQSLPDPQADLGFPFPHPRSLAYAAVNSHATKSVSVNDFSYGSHETTGRLQRNRFGQTVVCSVRQIFLVPVRSLAFPRGSLSLETTVVVSFRGAHSPGKIGIESGANLFELDLVDFHLVLGKNSDRLHALEDTNQTVHLAIP